MADEANKEAKARHKRGALRKIAGLLLFVSGVFWLAHKAGWIPMDHRTGIFWPAIVIAFGLYLLLKDVHGGSYAG